MQYINTAAQQSVGALVVCQRPKALCDAIKQARDAGMKVVTFDSDTNPDCRDLFVNQARRRASPSRRWTSSRRRSAMPGEVAILSASANATNQNAWID